VADPAFKDLLRRAAKDDPVMKLSQDEFFDEVYWKPAFASFKTNKLGSWPKAPARTRP
jgi:chitosanase